MIYFEIIALIIFIIFYCKQKEILGPLVDVFFVKQHKISFKNLIVQHLAISNTFIYYSYVDDNHFYVIYSILFPSMWIFSDVFQF